MLNSSGSLLWWYLAGNGVGRCQGDVWACFTDPYKPLWLWIIGGSSRPQASCHHPYCRRRAWQGFGQFGVCQFHLCWTCRGGKNLFLMSKHGSTEITSLEKFVTVIVHLESNVILIHRLCNSSSAFVSWFMVKLICVCLCNAFCVYYLGWYSNNKLKHQKLFACTWLWWWRTSLLWEGPYGLQELERWQSQSCCISVCELSRVPPED